MIADPPRRETTTSSTPKEGLREPGGGSFEECTGPGNVMFMHDMCRHQGGCIAVDGRNIASKKGSITSSDICASMSVAFPVPPPPICLEGEAFAECTGQGNVMFEHNM